VVLTLASSHPHPSFWEPLLLLLALK
jgi:hypothetical protein